MFVPLRTTDGQALGSLQCAGKGEFQCAQDRRNPCIPTARERQAQCKILNAAGKYAIDTKTPTAMAIIATIRAIRADEFPQRMDRRASANPARARTVADPPPAPMRITLKSAEK